MKKKSLLKRIAVIALAAIIVIGFLLLPILNMS